MCREAATYNHTTDLEEYTASVTGYISKCFFQDHQHMHKPETIGDCWSALTAENPRHCLQVLWQARAQQNYAERIHGHFINTKDTWCMWQGIQAITDCTTTPLVCDRDALLPDTMKDLFTELLLLHIAHTGQHISVEALQKYALIKNPPHPPHIHCSCFWKIIQALWNEFIVISGMQYFFFCTAVMNLTLAELFS